MYLQNIYLSTYFGQGTMLPTGLQQAQGTNDSCPQELPVYLGYNQTDSSFVEY